MVIMYKLPQSIDYRRVASMRLSGMGKIIWELRQPVDCIFAGYTYQRSLLYYAELRIVIWAKKKEINIEFYKKNHYLIEK